MRWLPKTYAILVISLFFSLSLSLCHIMLVICTILYFVCLFSDIVAGEWMAGQVEDPFEQPHNTARSINARQLTRISQAFQMTRIRLTSAHHNQNSILSDLARPQISQLIITPTGSASAPVLNIGNYPPIRPEVHQARVMHPRPLTQHQFQNNVSRFNVGNFPPISPQVPHAGTTPPRPSVQRKTSNTRRVNNPNGLKVGEPSTTYNVQGQRVSNSNGLKIGGPSTTYNVEGQRKWRPRSQRQVS